MRCLAMIWVVLGLAACKPSSASDRAKARKEIAVMHEDNARWGELERETRDIRRAFAQRFAGNVKPGVGCGVCPDMCRYADLRQMPVTELQRRYRSAALQSGYPVDERMYDMSWLELLRLGCIVQDGDPAMQGALLELLDASEDAAVRYSAALHVMVQGFAMERGLEVMRELAGARASWPWTPRSGCKSTRPASCPRFDRCG